MNDLKAVIPEDKFSDKLMSAALWTAGVSWLLPWTTVMMALHKTVGAHRIEGVSRVFTRGQVALTGSKIRYVVDPAVDENEQYMFAQNHINHFDFVTMYNATKHFKQGIELEKHFKYPIYGWFMKSRGTIPVAMDRKTRLPRLTAGMQHEIDSGRSLLVFPEGTRTVDGSIKPFKRGVFQIARDMGISVVPTTVTGMFEVMRKGSLLIRPGNEITVYCDKPVSFAGLSDDELQAKIDEVRNVMVGRMNTYLAERYGSESGSRNN